MRRIWIDAGVSIAASVAVLVIAVAGGQMRVATTSPATATAAPAPMMSCLELPLTPTGTPGVHGVTHLCLTVDDVEATVDWDIVETSNASVKRLTPEFLESLGVPMAPEDSPGYREPLTILLYKDAAPAPDRPDQEEPTPPS